MKVINRSPGGPVLSPAWDLAPEGLGQMTSWLFLPVSPDTGEFVLLHLVLVCFLTPLSVLTLETENPFYVYFNAIEPLFRFLSTFTDKSFPV